MDALGQLAGGVAHDFNNILLAIAGYSHLLKNCVTSGDAREYVHELLECSQRASSLTQKLLAVSRQQRLEREQLNLNDLIEDMLRMIRRVLRGDVELHFRPDPNISPIHGDVGQLEQVLLNLCLNARDAMPDGGKINITTRSVHDGFDRSKELVVLSVADDGVGMDESTRQQAFEPFFTTKEKGKGTGLGLSTVYGIVKQHDGKIEIESAPQNGCKVDVYLPAGKGGAQPTKRPRSRPAARGGHERVLVIEDDGQLRRMIKRVLQLAGYDVQSAEVRHAMSSLGEQEQPQLVVLGSLDDHFCESLCGRLPIICISGPEACSRGAAPSTVIVLAKPFSPEDLLRAARDVLDKTTSLD
jgi:two-component system cell cycle sensor histidine kinase/response regulator CckA